MKMETSCEPSENALSHIIERIFCHDRRHLLNELGKKWSQATIGAVRYLADTKHLELCRMLEKLALVQFKPCKRHEHALKHILRYIIETQQYGIKFMQNSAQKSEPSLVGAVDVDYAGDIPTRISTTRVDFLYRRSLVIYACKLQATVA